VSFLFGAFVLGSIGALTGLAFWAKPIEYLLLGWVCYDLVRTQAISIRTVLLPVLAAAAIVIGYGVAEHFTLVPRLPGQRVQAGVPISTIGDTHELAGYLGIVSLLLVALWHRATSTLGRAVALLGIALAIATIFYTGARSEFVVLGLCFLGLLLWRPARLPAVVAIAAMAILFASPFVEDLLPRSAPIGSGEPTGAPSLNESDNVTDRFTGSELGTSLKIRFDIKWRAFIEQTARSPLLGLGPSAATEAADGYYMRSYVESGILGLLAFLALVGATFLAMWRTTRQADGLARAVGAAMVASTVFVALVSVLIDTWVASRVIELYWPLVGTALAAGTVAVVAKETVNEAEESLPAAAPA
jgi:O-antigen ligase